MRGHWFSTALQTNGWAGWETRCCTHLAAIPGRESLQLILLSLASHHGHAKLEGNQSSTVGYINLPHHRWKASIFGCIRSPVPQYHRTTLCAEPQLTISVKRGKRHSLWDLIRTGAVCLNLLPCWGGGGGEWGGEDEIANPWNASRGSLFSLEQQWALLIMCHEMLVLEWTGPTVQPQNKLHISLNLIGKINGMSYNGGN